MSHILQVTEHYKRVREFLRRCGHATPAVVSIPSEDERIRMARLVLEEAFELVNNGLGVDVVPNNDHAGAVEVPDLYLRIALEPPNILQIIDGACDLHYVTTCVLVGCGVPDHVMQCEVDDNNIEKFDAGGTIREDGKVQKPEGYPGPRIPKILREVIAAQQVEGCVW